MTELVIDNFAGAGGASLGISMALGRAVDIAINHDREAIEMHKANHPETRHYCEDIWSVNPLEVTEGRPVGLAWFSPDCTHHSKAKGGKPVKKNIRGQAWIVLRWAALVKPRVIILENVTEFQSWGPLTRENKPCPLRKGRTFGSWIHQFRRLGYEIEWRDLSAADYGAPTIRKRLFLVARYDNAPTVWPQPTHGPGLKPYRAAAECIDWSIPCPSIFERKRPLVENTLRRIARGIWRYVIEAKEPFIVQIGYGERKSQAPRVMAVDKPLGTVVATNKHALVVPSLLKNNAGSFGQTVTDPLHTITTGNRFGFVAAFLSRYYTGVTGSDLRQPTPTVTAIDHNALVAAHLTKFYGTNTGSDMRKPMPTATATGQHIGEVRAFLLKYTNTGQSLAEPLRTATSKATFGLVMVAGQQYHIADIGLRMLTPRELARAQGFPDSYVLTGTKTSQVAKIGNSVCPVMAEVLVRQNVKIRTVEADESAA